MKEPIISLENAAFQYSGSDGWAVDHVNLEIGCGEFVAVLGRNGSGKSTLAKLLNALILPAEGKITVDGRQATEENPYDVREVCGMVFQNPDNQIVATIVEEDCAFGLENMGVPTAEIRKRVNEALEAVGMRDRALSSPSMLSGGQKQRVAVAGVLAMRPKIIVFDESTAMLDPVGRRDILSIARRLNREDGITVIWITHFMDEAVRADRVVVMDGGRITMDGTPREVFEKSEQVLSYGLDVPEMMKLSGMLRAAGLELPRAIMTVDEMAVELCRLK